MILLLLKKEWSSDRFYRCLMLFFLVFLQEASSKDIGPCRNTDVNGGHCFGPGAHWQHDAVCISPRCHVPDTREFKFRLRISIRQLKLSSSSNSPPVSKLWIRGSGPGLSWSKPILLQKSAAGLGLWVTNIAYRYDSESLLCSNDTSCILNQRVLEFRVYQDEAGKQDMIGPNLYVNLPVGRSIYGHQLFITPNVDVFPWFGGRTIHIEEFTVSQMSPPFEEVKVNILYPPSFDYNVRRRYPVVIIFGMREGPLITPLLESMYTYEASIREAFILNIHYVDKAPFCAFNPYSKSNAGSVNLVWRCKVEDYCYTCHKLQEMDCPKEIFIGTVRRYLFPMKCGGEGDALLDIIEKEIIPHVISKIKGRLLVDFSRDRLSIIGFDGAGLLACHAAISRPHIYQNAACLSAPFHWPLDLLDESVSTENSSGIDILMSDLSHDFMFFPERRGFYAAQKYYLDYGETDNYHFPIVDMNHYMDLFMKRLKIEFGVPNRNILFFKGVPKAGNNYFTEVDGGTEVLNRVRIPLLFFLRAEGGPNRNLPHLIRDTKSTRTENKDYESISPECLLELQIYQQQSKSDHVMTVPLDIYFITLGKLIICVYTINFTFFFL